MSKLVFEREHVLEAIERTLSQGQSQEDQHNWLFKNYPATPGGQKPKNYWFLVDSSGRRFPLKPLARLAKKVARDPSEIDNTRDFRNRFRDLGFAEFDSKKTKEAKRRRQQVEVLSREQAKFRDEVFKRYGRVCIISGCKAEEALEAAHIVPVKDDGPDKAENGIPLRADIHRLFDAGKLNIDPKKWRLVLASGIAKNCPDSGRWKISPRFRKANHGKDVIAELRKRSRKAKKRRKP